MNLLKPAFIALLLVGVAVSLWMCFHDTAIPQPRPLSMRDAGAFAVVALMAAGALWWKK